MATRTLNLRKNIQKSSSEAIRGMKLKLVEMMITLASQNFFIAVAHVLSALWHLIVSIDL